MSENQAENAGAEKPTTAELEADIADTRERLAASVDQLAAKLDVKAQAQEKVEQTRLQAQEKVQHTKEQVVGASRGLLERFQAASRPVQVSIGAVPVTVLLLIILRRARR